MNKRIQFLIGLIFTFTLDLVAKELPKARPESVGMSSERLARISPVMQKYIDDGLTPGIITAIVRKGKIVYFQTFGDMDIASEKPMDPDAIFRIASMTKPITSVALMMLWEEGKFQLDDPVSKYIPAFANPKVSTTSDASGKTGELVPAKRQITIRDLLIHTAGLANRYFGNTEAYEKAYTGAKDLKELTDRIANLPLNYHPGEKWEYSHATDIVGHLVEIISGLSLDDYFREKIFIPLEMHDTHFYLDAEKANRLTTLYSPGKDYKIVLNDPGSVKSRWISGPKTLYRGAGGLVSTVHDYLRFQQMMLNGGKLDKVRLLAPSTVSLMFENHTGDLPLWIGGPGMGFGLGYGVVVDRGEAATPYSNGTVFWGGAYCTMTWIDPEQELVGVVMTQVRPYNHINIRQDFRVLTYQAIVK